MTDRETGKLKGFGFCEFMDLATAESLHARIVNLPSSPGLARVAAP